LTSRNTRRSVRGSNRLVTTYLTYRWRRLPYRFTVTRSWGISPRSVTAPKLTPMR